MTLRLNSSHADENDPTLIEKVTGTMLRLLLVVALAAVAPLAGFGWGIEGHQIVADIAEAYLTPAARKQVDALLNGARMRDVSNYADEIRPFPGLHIQSVHVAA